MNTGWLRFFKKLVWGFFATLAAFCIFLLIVIFILVNSNSAQTQLFNYATSFLNDIGIHWQAGTSDISAKTHIRFKDLNIRFEDNLPLAGKIAIETFQLNYNLREILSRHVIVENFIVRGLDAKLTLESKQMPVEEESTELEFVDIKSIFDSIPGNLELKQIALSDINILLDISSNGSITKAQLSDFSLDFSGLVSSKKTNLTWSLGVPLNVQHEVVSDKGQLRATSRLNFETQGSLDYASKGDMWSLQFKTKKLEIEANDTRVELDDDTNKQSFSFALGEFRLSLSQELTRELVESLEETVLFGLENSRFALSGDLKFDDLSIRQKSGSSNPMQLFIPKVAINHSLNTRLLPTNHLSQAITGDLSLNFSSKPLKIINNNEQTLIHDLAAFIDGGVETGKFRLGADLSMASIQTKLATGLNGIHLNLDSRGDMEGKRIDLDSKLSISEQTILTMGIVAENLKKQTLLSANGFVSMWRIGQIGRINALYQKPLGRLEINLAQKVELVNEKPVWDYDLSKWPEFDAGWKNTIDINQLDSGTKVYVNQVQVKSQGRLDTAKMNGSVDVRMKKIWHPMFKRTFDGSCDLTFRVDSDLKSMNADLDIGIEEQNIFVLTSKLEDAKGKLSLNNKAMLKTNSLLYELSEKLKSLDSLGEIQLTLEQTGRVQHSLDSAFQLDAKAIQQSLVESELSFALTQSKVGDKPFILLNKPVTATMTARMRDDTLTVDLASDIRAIDIPELGSVDAIKLSVKGNVGQITPSKKISIETKLSVLSPRPAPELTKGVELSKLNLNIESNASMYMNDLEDVNLKAFKLRIGDNLLKLAGNGTYVSGGKARVKFLAESDLGSALAAAMPAEGKVRIPIEFRSLKDNIYALDLAPEFHSVSIEYGDLSIRNLNGLIKVKESIKLSDDGRFGFSYLDDFNPFARVDYESIQQLYRSKPVFWFESLRLPKGQVIGPLTAQPEVRQNLVLLNNVTLNAFDGSLVGRVLINIDPNDPNIGFLGRFTRIKPALMAKSDKVYKGNEYISGRSAFVFDITKRLAKGRFDITTIGKAQLLDILNILDPKYEDSQINNARKALALSYPEKVSVEMDQGLMNMTVKLSGILSKSINIHSIPLTPLIQAHLSGVFSSFEQIFKAEDLGDG